LASLTGDAGRGCYCGGITGEPFTHAFLRLKLALIA